MLTSPLPPLTEEPEFTPLLPIALRVLHRRFRFQPIRVDPSELRVVRLVPRG